MPPSKRKRSSQAAAAASAEARAEPPATVTVLEQEAGGGQEPWSWQPHIVAAREKAHRAGRVGPTHPDVMPDIIHQAGREEGEGGSWLQDGEGQDRHRPVQVVPAGGRVRQQEVPVHVRLERTASLEGCRAAEEAVGHA